VKKVAVIGAGITGLLAAYYLARDGHSVTVYEQERYPAMRTSFANGGQVSVSNSEVWTTWSNVKKGVKWMFTKDAPLLIRPGLDIDKISWLVKFLWYTLKKDYAYNTAKTIRLGIESRKLYQDLIKEENLEFDQSYCGILHIYKSQEYFNGAREVQELYQEHGCEWNILNAKDTVNMDPALRNIKDVVGGVWTGADWTGDIHKFCVELSKLLHTKYWVNFNFDTKISQELVGGLSNNNDAVVISAGVGSVELAKFVGESLPIYPVKGYSITINVREDQMNLIPKASLLDDQAKIVTSTLGNRFRVAGTAELAGENYDIRRDRVEPLLKWVHTNFPELDANDYSSWACLRPMTPNMMPIVKQSKKNSKVFYHTGHGHLGWTLAPYTAKLIAEHCQKDSKYV
jgi:D-amino-acid dehydrogenase